MDRKEQLRAMIHYLAPDMEPARQEAALWRQYRALVNIRAPGPAAPSFLKLQDAFLQGELARKGITDSTSLTPVRDRLCLWQGDITTLKADAVVNAANSGLTGCYHPLHGCIDNAIHTFAGVQLREECARLMARQGRPEPPGLAKLTRAYNLPSRFVLHTVGPAVRGAPTADDCARLRSCYRSCLTLAAENRLTTVAFCCISTGEFRFPNDKAAGLAVDTVTEFLKHHPSMRVVFNVYLDLDFQIYTQLLS